jgi:signal transduction histidine kinase
VVQEGLTNAIRHSRRPRITVRIDVAPTRLDIGVHSSGPAHQSSYGGSGRGLDGLRERVHALGGVLESGRRPGDRYCLDVSLPLGVT